jgi:uncharacterized protein (TIGR02266 family)
MYVGLLLKRLNFDVLPAESGLEVLKLVKLTEPDLIILDLNMVTVDGFHVLKFLKEDKQTAHIPVIIASVDADKKTIERCTQMGCFDYLTKPIKIAMLHESIQNCFLAPKGIKRNHLRIPCNIKTETTYQGKQITLYSETLSEGGLYLRKQKPLPVGTRIPLILHLPGRGTVTVSGEVIYIKELFGDLLKLSPGMALAFREISAEDSRIIKKFIEDGLARDLLDDQEETVIYDLD